jgi:hypothetical protein
MKRSVPLFLYALGRASTTRAGLITVIAFIVGVAQAQQISPMKPADRFDRMSASPIPGPQLGPVGAIAPEASAQAAPENDSPVVLRHLPNNIQGYRLAGEVAVSEWPIYLTDTQAKRELQFQLGYLSAVSVMPETSGLTLAVNDQPVGMTPVNASQAVKTIVFEIPPGLMRPGFNSVRLSTQLRHRVDCSLEATNELWAQVDPSQTGIIFAPGDASIDTLADLGALPPNEQGALPIRAFLAEKAAPVEIARMLRVAQLISIIGRFEQPVIDFGPLAEGPYGVNLLVGTPAKLAEQVDISTLGAIVGPRAAVLPPSMKRRTTIVITGLNDAQLDAAIEQFLVAAKPRGAEQGLRAAAAFPGFRMEGEQRVQLSQLGLKSQEFDGRLYRTAFNIIMPSDFFPADYGRATLRMAGGYAPGLAPRAQLVVNVNGRTAVSLALLKTSGEVFKDNPLPLPLGFFRPGLNRIEIEAHVPTAADHSCAAVAGREAANRFLFLDSTEIEIPRIARVARMPDLAVTATGGFPYASVQHPPKLFLPSLDPKSLGAAATLVAHLAVSVGRPLDFQIATSAPGKGDGPTLAVAPFAALSADLLKKLEMPATDMAAAWRGANNASSTSHADEILVEAREIGRKRIALERNLPMACHPPARVEARPEEPRAQAPAGAVSLDSQAAKSIAQPADLYQKWDARLAIERRTTTRLINWANHASEWIRSKFTDAASWIHTEFQREDGPLIGPSAQLAVGQGFLGDGGADVWTIVTAPDADALADNVACLVDPRVSRQISGRLSVLSPSEMKIGIVPVDDAHFVVTQPLSVDNLRLIVAGWFSLHTLHYVVGALALALILTAATTLFVRNVGRRTQ